MIDLLPDALADALGLVVADMQREWRRDVDRLSAESRIIVAELRADVVTLKAALKDAADQHVARVSDAIAGMKNDPGKDADPQVAAEIAAKLVSDELSGIILADVAAIHAGLDEIGAGIEGKITEKVAAAVAEMPPPPDMAPVIAEMVRVEFAALPPAEPGHTPTPEELAPIVSAEVDRVIEAQPKPEPGHTPTIEELAPIVEMAVQAEVAARVAALPLLDPELVAGIVAERLSVQIGEAIRSDVEIIRADVAAIAGGVDEKIAVQVSLKIGELPDMAETVAAMVAALLPVEPGTVDPDELRSTVIAEIDAALKARPVPSDGHTPTVEELAPIIESAVARAVGAQPKPEDGRTPTPEELAPLVDAAAVRAVAALRVPEDGHTPTPEELAPLVDIAVSRSVAALPKPADGHTPTAEELAPLIETALSHALAARPVPKDGVGLAGALIDRAGSLIVTMTSGAVQNLGPVIGGDGDDGAPGLGFDDLSVAHDGDRGFVFRMARGDQVKEFPVSIPVMIYRGVYRDDAGGYHRGDVVTIRGSMYHCDVETQDKPGEGSKDWTLAVKNGKDGRDGKGEPGRPGTPGKAGRDLTQIGPDGTKW